MSDAVPASVRHVVVGAGIHGLSTAWHLAMELERRDAGSGEDIVVLDKTGPRRRAPRASRAAACATCT